MILGSHPRGVAVIVNHRNICNEFPPLRPTGDAGLVLIVRDWRAGDLLQNGYGFP